MKKTNKTGKKKLLLTKEKVRNLSKEQTDKTGGGYKLVSITVTNTGTNSITPG